MAQENSKFTGIVLKNIYERSRALLGTPNLTSFLGNGMRYSMEFLNTKILKSAVTEISDPISEIGYLRS